MSDPALIVDDSGGIRTIIFDRPEVKNALSSAMRSHLCVTLSEAERDAGIRAVIITGTDPAFTAGVDFKEVTEAGGERKWSAYDAQFSVNPGNALRAMSTPVICAVNGVCVSGGLEIVLSAAFAVASDRARFADTHAKLGVVATWGLTALLPRAVGVRMAKELSITGRFVEADEALHIGLVNHVVPHDDLLRFTRALAEQIVDTSAMTEVLRLYNRGDGLSLAEALALETEHVTRRTFDPAAARKRFDAR
jgi:enoyl-CoA hydratase